MQVPKIGEDCKDEEVLHSGFLQQDSECKTSVKELTVVQICWLKSSVDARGFEQG